MKPSRVAQFALFLLSCSATLARGAEVAKWVGGNGLWSDATKWSGGVVPANSGGTEYAVNIDNGNAAASNVTLQFGAGFSSPIALDALTIDGGDTLSVQSYTVSTNALNVNGLLDIGYSGTVNLPPDSTLRGTGMIRFTSGFAQLGVSTGTMTIDDGMTISAAVGGGIYYSAWDTPRFGSSGASLVNRGVVDVRGGLIVSGSAIDNRGTFRVSDGGQLTLDTDFSLGTIGNLVNDGGEFVIYKTLQNVGQTLQVMRPRGWVLAAGGTVSGGTVSTTGAGYLYVPYLQTGTLRDVALDGDVHVNGSLNITGTFAGSGTVKIVNPEAIEGVGVINVNAVPRGITIRGGQSAAFDDPGKARIFVSSNAGTIRAERSIFGDRGILRIALPLINRGTLEVSDAGTLRLEKDLTFEVGGKLRVDGGGLLEVMGDISLDFAFTSLDVLPKTGGGAYENHVVATYTGRLFGEFEDVIPGISVSYATPHQIVISGTPVPEPALTGLALGVLALLAGCRHRRRRR